MKKEAIKLFEERKVRTIWDDTHEIWYFSIVDVVAILTDSPNPQTYWRVLKKRLKEEGNETVTNCNALKLKALMEKCILLMLLIQKLKTTLKLRSHSTTRKL